MAPATLEMTIMAAEDLKNLAMFGKMSVYAVAWVDPYVKRPTRIRRKGGRSPVWNEWISLSLDSVRHYPNAHLTLQIFSESSMGDKVVGTARLSLQEIYRISATDGNETALVTLQLQRPSGRIQGIVSLSLRVTGDDALQSSGSGLQLAHTTPPTAPPTTATDKVDPQEPVTGIPVLPYAGPPYYNYGAGTTSTGYPSLTAMNSYDVAATTGLEMVQYANPNTQYRGYPGYYYGNNPTQGPYPYVQPPRPQSRSNGSILLGLLGGAIGGLILGDILS